MSVYRVIDKLEATVKQGTVLLFANDADKAGNPLDREDRGVDDRDRRSGLVHWRESTLCGR